MDAIGPRLTGSPNLRRANEWTRDQLTAMGCSNAHLEDWSEFGMVAAAQHLGADDFAGRGGFHRPGRTLVAIHRRRNQWPSRFG